MAWKRTEKSPDFANHCKRICARYGVDYYGFDVVRDAIEETLEGDPIGGSVPLSDSLPPELRQLVYEETPWHWDLPSLVIVFEVDEAAQEITLLEIWTEEELEEQT